MFHQFHCLTFMFDQFRCLCFLPCNFLLFCYLGFVPISLVVFLYKPVTKVLVPRHFYLYLWLFSFTSLSLKCWCLDWLRLWISLLYLINWHYLKRDCRLMGVVVVIELIDLAKRTKKTCLIFMVNLKKCTIQLVEIFWIIYLPNFGIC